MVSDGYYSISRNILIVKNQYTLYYMYLNKENACKLFVPVKLVLNVKLFRLMAVLHFLQQI